MSICFCEKKWLEAYLKNSGAIVSCPNKCFSSNEIFPYRHHKNICIFNTLNI